MAEPVERSGGNGFIYFVVGALVIAVAVIAYFAFANEGAQRAEIDIDTPALEAPDVDVPDVDVDTPDVNIPDADIDVDVND